METTTTITASLFRPIGDDRFNENLEVSRYRALNFIVGSPFSEDLEVLEWIFAATNAPTDFLDEEQQFIFKAFYEAKECSLSVGDVIQLGENFYLCKNVGWEKIENYQSTVDLD